MQNMTMIYGYARVSTETQDITGQLAQLKAAGCEKVFRDKLSGATADRPQLRKLMADLSHGDVVIIPAVDRLSRDTTDLLVIARQMQQAEAGIRSLAEVADPACRRTTTTSNSPEYRLLSVGQFLAFGRTQYRAPSTPAIGGVIRPQQLPAARHLTDGQRLSHGRVPVPLSQRGLAGPGLAAFHAAVQAQQTALCCRAVVKRRRKRGLVPRRQVSREQLQL